METILFKQHDGIARVTINRPGIRNAFNPLLISELTEVFSSISVAAGQRVVVLEGTGKVFCAGADLNWMREMAGYDEADNLKDARLLAAMLKAIDSCPVPVIAKVQRAAFGGAIGLLACCDTVICTDDCIFAFSEVRLGISPATIAPYVIRKIGATHARDLFLSGQAFDAGKAFRTGLVHEVVSAGGLDQAVDDKIGELLKAGPAAAAATKQLVHRISDQLTDADIEYTVELIAKLRVSPEGQEGLLAFLQKRPPDWMG